MIARAFSGGTLAGPSSSRSGAGHHTRGRCGRRKGALDAAPR